MNRVLLFLFGAVCIGLLASGADLGGQPPGKKGPFKDKKGKAGFKGKGGFERPLAPTPRQGNPGASPSLTDADFKEIITAAKSFDANKDGKLQKSELPEMFASFFDRADTNRDGVLDQAEQSRVLNGAAKTTVAPAKKTTERK